MLTIILPLTPLRQQYVRFYQEYTHYNFHHITTTLQLVFNSTTFTKVYVVEGVIAFDKKR